MIDRAANLAPPVRKRIFLYLWLAGMATSMVLFLGMGEPGFNLAVAGLMSAGLVVSYYLGKRFEGPVLRGMDVVAIGIAVYFAYSIYNNQATWGTQLGYALGWLWGMLGFGAFRVRLIYWILWVSPIFTVFTSLSTLDLKFMLLVPLQIGLILASLIELRSAELGKLQKTRWIPGGAEGPGRSWLQTLKLAGSGTAVVLAFGLVTYLVIPHQPGSAYPNLHLPEGNKITPEDRQEQQQSAGGSEDQEPENRRGESESRFYTGFSGEASLEGSGSLQRDPSPVMTLKASRNGYLRAAVFDEYTGRGWERSERLRSTIPPDEVKESLGGTSFYLPLVDFPSRRYAEENLVPRGFYVSDLQPEASGRQRERHSYNHRFSGVGMPADRINFQLIKQEIEFLEPNEPYFFSFAQPAMINNISRTGRQARAPMYAVPRSDQLGQVRAAVTGNRHQLPRRFSYTVTSVVPNIREQWLEDAPPFLGENNFFLEHYTQLPTEPGEGRAPVSEEFIRYARKVANQNQPASMYGKVRNIYNYLTDPRKFDYSLEFPDLPEGREAAEFFVNESQEGYCEYFATTMVVMLRANNIPARYVTGYQPGDYSLIHNAYLIRNSDAHSWVEVYFKGYGWIKFDPTPSSTDLFNASQTKQLWRDVLTFFQNLFLINPHAVKSRLIVHAQNLTADMGRFWGRNWLLLTALLATGGGIWFAAVRVRRNREDRPEPARNEIIAATRQLIGALEDAGIERSGGETLGRFLERAERETGWECELSAEELAELAYLGSFSSRAPGPDESERYREAVESILGSLRENGVRNE